MLDCIHLSISYSTCQQGEIKTKWINTEKN